SLFLRVAAEGKDGIHYQRALHADEAADAAIDALQLLHDEPVFHVSHGRAAVPFEVGAEESEVRHFRDQLFGKARVAKAIADEREDALVSEAARGLAHHELLFAEERIDGEIINASK